MIDWTHDDARNGYVRMLERERVAAKKEAEDARRLARYDEAIRLLEDWRKFGDLETNEMPYGDTAAFLAAEGKVAG